MLFTELDKSSIFNLILCLIKQKVKYNINSFIIFVEFILHLDSLLNKNK